MWNMEKIRHTASEEMSFENVDGRMPDACIYYKLTYEPTAQVSLKDFQMLNISNIKGHV